MAPRGTALRLPALSCLSLSNGNAVCSFATCGSCHPESGHSTRCWHLLAGWGRFPGPCPALRPPTLHGKSPRSWGPRACAGLLPVLKTDLKAWGCGSAPGPADPLPAGRCICTLPSSPSTARSGQPTWVTPRSQKPQAPSTPRPSETAFAREAGRPEYFIINKICKYKAGVLPSASLASPKDARVRNPALHGKPSASEIGAALKPWKPQCQKAEPGAVSVGQARAPALGRSQAPKKSHRRDAQRPEHRCLRTFVFELSLLLCFALGQCSRGHHREGTQAEGSACLPSPEMRGQVLYLSLFFGTHVSISSSVCVEVKPRALRWAAELVRVPLSH
ncbi:PREDICTED: uncharacterized protein LOC102013792 isoform X1 [Chinchilla lanigera]|uniref:uncharacterized protein LOC102013792 isoform X1 n=1 Tax=Chinchilla lanigera TaxID=34839 RepID=UPI00038F0FA4|nr:PREDICTED: uncharacterized protein LOC102013792 isoform X1 [Chinchilla lanigera]